MKDAFITFIHTYHLDIGGLFITGISWLLLILMYQAHKSRKLDWSELVTSQNAGKVSLTKFLQLVGGITGTWIVIYTTLHDKLTYDILLVYLTYVGAIDGWSKFVAARYSQSSSSPVEKESSPVTENSAESAKKIA